MDGIHGTRELDHQTPHYNSAGGCVCQCALCFQPIIGASCICTDCVCTTNGDPAGHDSRQ